MTEAATTLYKIAGGADGVYRLASAFYDRVLADPLLLPLFKNPDEDHRGRMAMWLGQLFGGPPEHDRQRGGFPTVLVAHRGLRIAESQRQQWVVHMLAASEEVSLPAPVMSAFEPFVRNISQAVLLNSHMP